MSHDILPFVFRVYKSTVLIELNTDKILTGLKRKEAYMYLEQLVSD